MMIMICCIDFLLIFGIYDSVSSVVEGLQIALYTFDYYIVSQKTRHSTHVDNFAKNWSIFKILSPLDSEQNFIPKEYCRPISNHTLQMLLHYVVKLQKTLSKDVVLKYFFGDVPA